MTLQVIEEILSQHAEEVAILWSLRTLATTEPHYRFCDLAKLDGRLLSHLDGLFIAESRGWRAGMAELTKWPEPGEIFLGAMLAWRDDDDQNMRTVMRCGAASLDGSRALVSSLGWLTDQEADPWIDRLLVTAIPYERRIGIAACAVRRRDPGKELAHAVSSSEGLLQAWGLRAVGELARRDLLPAAKKALESPEPHVRFSAAWSVARLEANEQALSVLQKTSETPLIELRTNSQQNSIQHRAIQLVLRRMQSSAAAAWLNELSQRPELVRQAVIGTGIVGLPESIPWLLQLMPTPALARVAGEAFTMITGLDLTAEKLDAPWPAGFTAGPTEDPTDDNVAMDPDENLPWPDAAQLTAWWQKHATEFNPGTRYLCGQPLTEEWIEQVLRFGYQRQRAAAALELALLRPDQPLFNVRAPGHRQQELLGLR